MAPAGVLRVPCIHDGIPDGRLYVTPPFGGNPAGGLGLGNPVQRHETQDPPPVSVKSHRDWVVMTVPRTGELVRAEAASALAAPRVVIT